LLFLKRALFVFAFYVVGTVWLPSKSTGQNFSGLKVQGAVTKCGNGLACRAVVSNLFMPSH